MDSLIAAAARALVAGDALGALKRVGVRDDPPALALRGIAMAQLGEHPRARELPRRGAPPPSGAPPAASAPTKSWRAPAVSSQRPRWPSPCATYVARRAHWRQRRAPPEGRAERAPA